MEIATHNEAGRCRIKGCRIRRIAARQLCKKHYDYHRRHGTVDSFPATIKPRIKMDHACEHPPSANCYWNHKCRCEECRNDFKRRSAQSSAKHLTGRGRTVPAADLMPHLEEQLSRYGVTKRQCAEDTGLKYTFVKDLTNGRVKNVTPQVAATLMAWNGTGWCETCGYGVRAYLTGRYCKDCYDTQRRQNAA